MMMMMMMIRLFFLLTFLTHAFSEDYEFEFKSFRGECNATTRLLCYASASSPDDTLHLTQDPDETTGGPSGCYVGRIIPPGPWCNTGSAFYTSAVRAWPAIFSTSFTFSAVKELSNANADGLVWVMYPVFDSPPLHSWGGYLGYMNSTLEGVDLGRLGVEFDTFKNSDLSDIDDNHVSIITTSILKPLATASVNKNIVDFKSGKDVNVKIDYNGETGIFEVYAAHPPNQLTSVLSHTIPLNEFRRILPRDVLYTGFTSASGPYPTMFQVSYWNFTSHTVGAGAAST